MTVTNEQTYDYNGYKLHVIDSKKFKTVDIVVKFKATLAKDTITYRALLPFVLQQGTRNYPTQHQFRQALDNLYGAHLSIDGGKKGNNHILSFRMEVANQAYLTTETNIFEEAIKFLHEVIYFPKATEQSFDTNVVTREKQTLKQKINAIVDNKMSYANMRLIDEMCEDESYRLHVHGYEEDLDTIDEKNLYRYYQQLLQEDKMDIYVLGDFSSMNVSEYIQSYFNADRQPKVNQIQEEKPTIQQAKEVIEKQPVQQAKLHLGYRSSIKFADPLYPALQVFNGVFGGFPSSKLFMNVREKNSLAYYAASRFESHKGLLFVFSGIDPKDFYKAKEIIVAQIDDMVNGEFSADDVEEAKKQITNQWKETIDNPNGLIEILYHQVLAETTQTPEDFLSQISTVTKADVLKVAQQLQLDTVYFLTADGGENDE
ncbi:hypothetical protein Pryu01_00192 [Paraliobacillus ryukyuensis]|uniref:Putative Zn-dependent peptidase n=1 Tax=Paraliobacillus ryukyuensis TaxID=200904 RepID=A0A366EIA9_9BACI|nr:pitrilysin family protein [Paraliobacillus ryukyuensis]RBP01736.1 putative Zn-dependent peptidase [Paraliobacillus ryukyuensis]